MNEMDNKAQGALEYLLLIGGAVLIAAVVITLLAGIGPTASHSAHTGSREAHEGINTLEHALII